MNRTRTPKPDFRTVQRQFDVQNRNFAAYVLSRPDRFPQGSVEHQVAILTMARLAAPAEREE
jgi:hypothetical protein